MPSTETRRIDAHHHLWDLAVTPQPWIQGPAMAPIDRSFLAADLIDAAAAHVDGTIMVQTITEPGETPVMLRYAADTALIEGVVGWVDLTAGDVADRLRELRDGPGGEYLVGIRHQVQGEDDAWWLMREDVRRGLTAVGEAGLVYDLLTMPHQLPAAIAVVRELDEMRFSLNHISKPPIGVAMMEPWATDIAKLAASENIVCKLSGMITEADWAKWSVDDLRPYADTVLEAFGPQRVMFGSDWPVCLLAGEYAVVVDSVTELVAELSTDEQARIWGATAIETYGLGG